MKKGKTKKLDLNRIQVSKLTDLQSIKGGCDDVSMFPVLCPPPEGNAIIAY